MPVLAKNRKARFDYEIEDTIEAGMVLVGSEVKSIRDGGASIAESYIRFEGDDLVLVNAHVAKYEKANMQNHDPTRMRILLLHKRQLDKLHDQISQDGYTAVPLSLYTKNGLIKCEVAICKAKKKYDKRQTIKDRDWKRDQARLLKDS